MFFCEPLYWKRISKILKFRTIRYRENKIRVCKTIRELVIQWIKMLNMNEDDILEGMNGLLLSQKKREKSILKSSSESFNNPIQLLETQIKETVIITQLH